ncbi:sugar transferase [Candidatus Uhrbacteria bacterium]|nr:sugar transferase [Candidatus Uhrbacteria bacterium]
MRIKRIDLTFTALLVPLDILALYGAGLGAYLLRYSRFVTEVRPILQDLPFAHYVQTVSVFVAVWVVLFAMAGLYATRARRAWNEFGRVALACTSGTMVLIASVFFTRELATSRFIVIAVWAFSILLVFLERLVLRVIRHLLLRARIGHRNLVVIGASKAADGIVKEYGARPILGYTVAQRFAGWDDETRRAVERLRKAGGVDGILLADPDMPKRQAAELVAYVEDQSLAFHYLPDLYAAAFTNIEVSTSTGVPIIEVQRTPLDGWGRIAKRAFDIVFALAMLILTSPIVLVAVVLILLEDGLPVVFQNVRVGERGETFRLYKLRSMFRKYSIGPQFGDRSRKNLQYEKKLIAERSIKSGPVYKIADDPRVTRVGRCIRRWSIDELPQFWNVLMGDMSIVGPRPHQPREVEKYEPHQRRVLAIRPGITGLAQISGRSDLEFDDEVRLDMWYIENWSLLLDLYITLKTPFVVLYRKGSY